MFSAEIDDIYVIPQCPVVTTSGHQEEEKSNRAVKINKLVPIPSPYMNCCASESGRKRRKVFSSNIV
jgi:hypothetical protein